MKRISYKRLIDFYYKFESEKLLIRFNEVPLSKSQFKLILNRNQQIANETNSNLSCLFFTSKASRSYYAGLEDTLNEPYYNFDKLEEYIKSVIQTYNFKDLILVGDCSGGWPALYFGNKFNVSYIFIRNGLGTLDPYILQNLYDYRVKDSVDNIYKRLHTYKPKNISYENFVSGYNLLNFFNSSPETIMYFPNHDIDKFHASYFNKFQNIEKHFLHFQNEEKRHKEIGQKTYPFEQNLINSFTNKI